MEAIKELKRAKARARKKAPPEVVAEAQVAAPKKTKAKIEHKITVEIPKLPYGCVYSEDIGTRFTLYILELPAQMKAVKYYPQKRTEKEKELFLSWPMTLWFAVVQKGGGLYRTVMVNMYIAATKTPFAETGLKTKTLVFPMPNVGNNYNTVGSLCLGYSVEHIDLKDPVQFVNECMVALLSSKWNEGIPGRYGKVGIESLEDWHNKSKEDPEFHKKLKLGKDICVDVDEMLKSVRHNHAY